jgi:SAM-dependent methyltransferase
MWDERFSEPGYAYGTEANDFLVSVADRIPPGRVLCLAEGEGRNAVCLAGLGYEVTAVDTSTVGLEKARSLARERGVSIETVNADLSDYEIEAGDWQGIVSIFCHLPPVVRAALHERCLRGLAPGGVFILEGFTPRQLALGTGGPKDRELLMELDIIRQELPGLRLEIGREIEREVVEGKYHRGDAAVVQLLAVKP